MVLDGRRGTAVGSDPVGSRCTGSTKPSSPSRPAATGSVESKEVRLGGPRRRRRRGLPNLRVGRQSPGSHRQQQESRHSRDALTPPSPWHAGRGRVRLGRRRAASTTHFRPFHTPSECLLLAPGKCLPPPPLPPPGPMLPLSPAAAGDEGRR